MVMVMFLLLLVSSVVSGWMGGRVVVSVSLMSLRISLEITTKSQLSCRYEGIFLTTPRSSECHTYGTIDLTSLSLVAVHYNMHCLSTLSC